MRSIIALALACIFLAPAAQSNPRSVVQMSKVGVKQAARSFSKMLGSGGPVGKKISGRRDRAWVNQCLGIAPPRGKRNAPSIASPRGALSRHEGRSARLNWTLKPTPTRSSRTLAPPPTLRKKLPIKGRSPLHDFLKGRDTRIREGNNDDTIKRMRNRDYIFVLDTSGSISRPSFRKAKESLNKLAKSFCPISMGGNRDVGTKQMAVVLFSDRVHSYISFKESQKGLSFFTNKINNLSYRAGPQTKTAIALQYVANNVLRKGTSRLGQSDTSTDIIVITDGRCNSQCRTLPKDADRLREMGANVFAFGVDNARDCELNIISGSSGSFSSVSFNQFNQFADEMEKFAQIEGCA